MKTFSYVEEKASWYCRQCHSTNVIEHSTRSTEHEFVEVGDGYGDVVEEQREITTEVVVTLRCQDCGAAEFEVL